MIGSVPYPRASPRWLAFCLIAIAVSASADDLVYQSPDTILVMRPSSKEFERAHDGLEAYLDGQILTEKLLIDETTVIEDVRDAIEHASPNLVVLMDNRAVNIYKRWIETLPDGEEPPPAILLMTLYVESAVSSLANAAGITYEVFGILSLHYLRSLVEQPIERVGVVYPSYLRTYFNKQKKLCRAEAIELIGVELSRRDLKPRRIQRALKQLLRRENVDALWIFNDPFLLSDHNLARGWVPILLKCSKPILVGVESLIKVGHLGVFPNHHRLGEQAASLVLETRENGWKLTGERIRSPISVTKIVNLERVNPTRIKLNAEVLDEMDQIIQ